MNRTSPPPPQHKRLSAAKPDHARPETRFTGLAVSAGIAIGPVFRASEPAPVITRHKIQAADSAAEGARLDRVEVYQRPGGEWAATLFRLRDPSGAAAPDRRLF